METNVTIETTEMKEIVTGTIHPVLLGTFPATDGRNFVLYFSNKEEKGHLFSIEAGKKLATIFASNVSASVMDGFFMEYKKLHPWRF